MRSEDLYLADILSAADAVADDIRGVSWDQFTSERMIRSAVPRADIDGFRNVVVHEYFGVDFSRLIVEYVRKEESGAKAPAI